MKLSIVVACALKDAKTGTDRTPLLQHCLRRIKDGGHSDFECLVCCDGHENKVRDVVGAFDGRFTYDFASHRGKYSGGTQRNKAMRRATGKLIVFIDDDDWYLPGSLAKVVKLYENNLGHPLVWCMQNRSGHRLWSADPRLKGKEEGVLKRGYIGTPMFGIPNDQKRLGEWGLASYSDGDFIESTFKFEWPKPVWSKMLVAIVRNQGDRENWKEPECNELIEKYCKD